MKFESVMWKVVAVLFLTGALAWQAAQPMEDEEVYEAHDGGMVVPPPGGP
jgi:hypothetical protein